MMKYAWTNECFSEKNPELEPLEPRQQATSVFGSRVGSLLVLFTCSWTWRHTVGWARMKRQTGSPGNIQSKSYGKYGEITGKLYGKFIGTYWENTGRSSEELGRWRCRTGKTIARVGDFPTMFDYQRVNHGSLGRFFWDKIIFFYIWGKLLNYLNLWCGSNHWGKSPLLFHCW